MTPDRVLVAVFAATVKETGPFPLPVVAPEKVIQLSPAVAVHAHPVGARTLNESEPPEAPSVPLVGFS
jgi:hypothetical protein